VPPRDKKMRLLKWLGMGREAGFIKAIEHEADVAYAP